MTVRLRDAAAPAGDKLPRRDAMIVMIRPTGPILACVST
jgi:hypothetical protein